MIYCSVKISELNWFASANITDTDCQSACIVCSTLFRKHLIFEFRWLSICESRKVVLLFVIQVYTFLCNWYLMQVLFYSFYLYLGPNFKQLALYSYETTKFGTAQTSSKILLETMALVLWVMIRSLLSGEGHLCVLWTGETVEGRRSLKLV